MVEQQADNLMGCERIATAIHRTNPVGITIGYEADVMRVFFKKRLAARIILNDRFGINSSEQNIVPAIECRDFTGRAGEQLFKAACANAEKRVVRKA